MAAAWLLALDQGTTSSRALVFDSDGEICATGQREFRQHYPESGWVEHDPEEIWRTTVETAREAIAAAGIEASAIAAVGIANQRETVVVWDRATGEPVWRAIVWQDRRTAAACAAMKAEGLEAGISAKTGLLLDPYFSATKIAWILDNVAGARARAERGELAFGTVDSFLIWRLTGGRVHATDATNASRSLLLDIATGQWDEELLKLFRIPASLLPEVRDSSADFGLTEPELFGAALPIRGVAGDQQAATIGQACFRPGMVKSTYGTGCFALLNIGETPIASQNRLLTTIAYQLGGRRTYALEGSIFVAGAAVQWLRDGLGIIETAAQTGAMAAAANDDAVVMVPAFVGLGAPHWDPEARGAIFGLTRDSGPRELARAALESVCFQTHDLIAAMHRDWVADGAETVLRVDGGMARSDWTMQRLADILDAPVDRPAVTETTALGAAYLAGLAAGVLPPPDAFAGRWRLERRFLPGMQPADRERRLKRWSSAVKRTLTQPDSA